METHVWYVPCQDGSQCLFTFYRLPEILHCKQRPDSGIKGMLSLDVLHKREAGCSLRRRRQFALGGCTVLRNYNGLADTAKLKFTYYGLVGNNSSGNFPACNDGLRMRFSNEQNFNRIRWFLGEFNRFHTDQ